jgi:hypothetical protein
MKFIATFCFLLFGTIGVCRASDVRFYVESYQVTNTICIITNSSEHEIYILPICIQQEFYKTPSCSDCASNWISSRPQQIGERRDLVPLASKSSFKFSVTGVYYHPWRIMTVAFTKRVQIPDRGTPPPMDPKDRLELYTDEMQPMIHL